MTPTQFLEEFFRTHETLRCTKSATGGQLEAMKLGLIGKQDSSAEYRRVNAAEERFARYAVQIKIWATLSPEEQAVLIAQHNPIPPEEVGKDEKWKLEYFKMVRECELKELKVPLNDMGGECKVETKSGSLCRNKRIVGEPRCFRHRDIASAPVTKVTFAGEEYLIQSDEPGYVVVRGTKAVHRTVPQIADLFGWSFEKTRKLIVSGRAKISEHQLFHLLA